MIQIIQGDMIHGLKTWPEPFQAVWDGRKTFEFRKNDRGFKEGDRLSLQEWDPETEGYTGRNISARINYLLSAGFGLPEGYCIMSIGDLVFWEMPV
jgi:hypothetical protein